MAESILRPILNAFVADAILSSAVPSGLWLDEEPEEKSLPFVVVSALEELPEWASAPGPYIEKSSVRFAVYQVGALACDTICGKLKDCFDRAAMAFETPGNTLMKMERTRYQLTRQELRDANNNLVFEGLVEYDVWVSRTKN